ncbi:retropepsin-like aspartic peptidase RloA2 [Pseudomonas sp. NCHU5208]|uniref:retropepsin-like aspartic peptidase RloA2 n=1 Tax=unclassified Pseudomonas TaxID=196821 RepID=UPI00227ACD0E|nr:MULTISPECIES: ATP-dependent zinc protease [unclassified Pseudomonas]WAJ37063.1 ATP-dependent zinc protease [Pseudomonas sp. GOM7]
MKYLALLLASAISLPALADEQPDLYGRYELIKLPALGKTLKAKMDTGAMTASLSAKDIESFKRDGEDWVRFRLAVDGADDTLYEHPLIRVAEIKNRAEEGDDDAQEATYSQRPVIEMPICLGEEKRTIEVNLTDRSTFSYPLLIGASAMRDMGAAVNPAERYTRERPQC